VVEGVPVPEGLRLSLTLSEAEAEAGGGETEAVEDTVALEDAEVKRVRLDETVLLGEDLVAVPVREALADGCVGVGVRLLLDERDSVRVTLADTAVAELLRVTEADGTVPEAVALMGVEVEDAEVQRVRETDIVVVMDVLALAVRLSDALAPELVSVAVAEADPGPPGSLDVADEEGAAAVDAEGVPLAGSVPDGVTGADTEALSVPVLQSCERGV